MNPFTDSDLQRLKESIENTRKIYGSVGERASDELERLVFRLESAEYALMRFRIIPDNHLTEGIREAITQWQKAAGK